MADNQARTARRHARRHHYEAPVAPGGRMTYDEANARVQRVIDELEIWDQAGPSTFAELFQRILREAAPELRAVIVNAAEALEAETNPDPRAGGQA